MIVPAAAAVLVLVELHLAVPSVVWRFRRSSIDRVYGWLTMLVAVLAAVPALLVGLPTGLVVGRWDPMVAVAAAVAGSALPLVAWRLTGRRGGRLNSPGALLPARWIVGIATAEELLWRVLGPAAGQAVGWHPAVAMAAALCGFLLLHVPGFGFRRLPYLAVAGLLFTGCALAGGLLAAAAAHAAHNLVIIRVPPPPGGTPVRRESRDWPRSGLGQHRRAAPARGRPRRSRWLPPRPGH